MAATFSFSEFNGAGQTETTSVTNVNYKNIDDATTAYGSSPINAGSNSFTKIQAGKFTGSFNSVFAGLWSANTNIATLATGLTLKGTVTSTYAQPSATTNAALTTNFTTLVPVASGLTVLFSTTAGGSASSTLTASGYSQFLCSQLQTLTSASSGDVASIISTLQYSEN